MMKIPIFCLVAFLLLSATVGCSANREPARHPTRIPPTQPVTASRVQVDVSPPAVTQEPDPALTPTASQTVHATPVDTRDAAEQATIYTVQAGDTLWGIAIAHATNLDALLAANDLEDPDSIWAGQELVIPGTGVTTAAVATPTPSSSTPVLPPADAASPTLQRPFGGSQAGTVPTDVPETRAAGTPPSPVVDLQPLRSQALLEPMLHDWQKMNNCAPTTVAMALSYYNVLLTQFDTAPVLKGGSQDKNVSPSEIATYLHDQGFGGTVRVNGDIDTLLRLVSNDIPVIVEQWLDRPDDELTGHYRLVRGYDQTTQEIIVNDSYSGPKLHFSYTEFERLWRPFNRVYIPVYSTEREAVVQAVGGGDWIDGQMYERAIATAQAEIDALGDAYAWFNLGNSFLGLAEYARAADAFDQAIRIGLPPRMFWYQFGPFEAYNRTQQYQRVLELSAPLTGLALEELHYQRGIAYEGLGQPAAALAEYQSAVDENPRLTKAAEAAARLVGAGGG